MKFYIAVLIFFISQFVVAQTSLNLKINTEKTVNGYRIFAENNELMSISVRFDFTLNNMKSSLKNKEIIVVPPNTKKMQVAEISTINPKMGYSFKYQVAFNFGNSDQKIYDKDYVYELPFEKGKTYLVFQGYNGNFSHQNQNSLDFNLKEGEKIFASREGKVVALEEKNNTKCAQKECAKYNNFIRILHTDGTFGDYAHLKNNGVAVNLGDEIQKGQLIGYSGETGWATGPHLHFSVYINHINGERTYIPTKFRTQNATPEILKENKSYTRK